HKYDNGGIFNVKLSVIDTNKCSSDTIKEVIVYGLPKPDFMHDTLVCMNDTIKISNISKDAVSYYWNFGNGKTSTQSNPVIYFDNDGYFNIKLTAKNKYGCIDSIINKIHVIKPPEANFVKSLDSGCGPLQIELFDRSKGYNLNYNWDMGNSENSNQKDSIKSIYQQGRNDTTYYIKLNVTNICGSSNYYDSVKVKPIPVIVLGIDKKWSCSPVTFEFTNNLSYGNPDTFLWVWGDGTPSLKTTKYSTFHPIKHTYYVDGDDYMIFHIILVAANECGVDTVSKNITVYPRQVDAFFEPDTSTGCQPLTVKFKNDSKGYINVLWNFGDQTSPSFDISPVHTFTKSGNYQVTLVVNDSCGYDSASTTISVKPPPLLDFSYKKDSICVNEPSSFFNISKSKLSSFKWDFGDSTFSEIINPIHNYLKSGNKNVILYGTSANNNCPGSITKTIYIKPTPISSINTDKISGCIPLIIRFTGDSGSYHLWNFGNGNSSTLINPITEYLKKGEYDVSLISEFNNGCKDTSYAHIYVYPTPKSDFTVRFDSSCYIPLNVIFKNNSTEADGYQWIFGNGQISNNNDLLKVIFDTIGQYYNTLISFNKYGCSDTIKKPLLVYPTPKADFEIQNSKGCNPLQVSFINKSKNSSYYFWDFGNDFTSSEINPVILYKDSGYFNVQLISFGNGGCSDTVNKNNSVLVYPKPKAAFSYIPVNDPVDNSGKIQFYNYSKYSSTYLWVLGDGTTDSNFEPLHRYNMYGGYLITLYAENTFNCRDTASQSISIDYFNGLFVSNAFSPEQGPLEIRKFKPKGVGLKDYHIWIYDSWGNVIWESDKLYNTSPAEGWDGTLNGNPVMQDVFVWKIEATFLDGSVWHGKDYGNGVFKKYGSVTLLR
ncbi:MAG: PKD domain-containing protein, partial [Bacteroidota bacterium]|nr:PKD domain-containing protein [Bacteroidota bacterium]